MATISEMLCKSQGALIEVLEDEIDAVDPKKSQRAWDKGRDKFAAEALSAIISIESDADMKGECHDADLYGKTMMLRCYGPRPTQEEKEQR